MKTLQTIGHEGTLVVEDQITMSFDEDITHIMSVLTDMYSNSQLASIREPSINALDSHIASGVTRPVDITLPNRFDANFIVRDYGLGMSKENLIALYSKYGASTKRGSNAAAGMLGIGCKAPLQYTSQFLVKSVNNGIAHQVLVSRDDNGVGSIQFMGSNPTTETSGVEVKIPVRNVETFNREAKDFFSYWKTGTVLVNREAPVRFDEQDSVSKITDNFYVGRGQAKVIMGSIAYPLDLVQFDMKKYGFASNIAVIFEVPIGSVSFAPSRESLQYNKITLDTLHSVCSDLVNYSKTKIQADIDAKATPAEAVKVAFSWTKILPDISFTYKGDPFPQSYRIEEADNVRELSLYSNTDARSFSKMGIVSLPYIHSSYNVLNFKGSSVTANLKALIREHWQLNDKPHTYNSIHIYFWDKCPFERYLDPSRTLDISSMKNLKITKARAVSKDKLPQYIYYKNSTGFFSRVAYPEADTVYWIRRGLHNTYDFAKAIVDIDVEKTPLLLIASNQIEKFKRCHPEAISMDDYFTEKSRVFWGDISIQEQTILTSSNLWMRKIAEKYLKDIILDKELEDILLILQTRKQKHIDYVNLPMQIKPRGQIDAVQLASIRSLSAKYKMLESNYYNVAIKDMIEYINALYSFRKG